MNSNLRAGNSQAGNSQAGNLQAGSLFGIPFYLNVSWFFVLALVTFSYATGLKAQFPGLGTGVTVALGLMTALLLFTSVVLHELGHSFAARCQGIQVHSISLFLFGGVANLDRESDSPMEAFWVAIAGPLVSIALFGLLTIINLLYPWGGPFPAILNLVAYINLVLATFNLIPGLPLDGGNVLKALVWKLTGNRYQGTRVAGWIGQAIGGLAIGLGLLSVLGLAQGGSFWTILIGWFLLRNAAQAAQSATLQERLAHLTVGDMVTPESPIVVAHLTLREFADTVLLSQNSKWQRFLVKDTSDKLVGAISLKQLQAIPSEQWSDYRVQDLVQPVAKDITVAADVPLLQALSQLQEQGTASLTVVGDNGLLVGLLEKISLMRLMQGKLEVQLGQ